MKDFWSWAYSDILSNRNRAIFAEFLVANALGLTEKPRTEWDAVDLRYDHDKFEVKIEVKAGGYIQSWNLESNTKLKFDIAKKKGWDAKTWKPIGEPERSSHLYVFCIYSERNTTNPNVLDTSKWRYFLVPTLVFDVNFGDQKEISEGRLSSIGQETTIDSLKCEIDRLIHTFKPIWFNMTKDIENSVM